ncbi:MAG TPA: hypothetical protein VGO68_11300 [Pyrinomonadaceae bacterium]|nr:hypothetical protein [Pyrinomonadaceae bacterium]
MGSRAKRAAAWLFTLFLLSFVLQVVVAEDDDRPSAAGHFQISIDNEPTKIIDFNARLGSDGIAFGDMSFTFNPSSSDSKPDGEAGPQEKATPFFLKANFDCLIVKGNKAVMGGSVTQASSERYLGRRILLVVQDNGHGTTPALGDKLTWGVYKAPSESGLATDNERPEDLGAGNWVASDAERPDDLGFISQKNEPVGCQSFPLSAFSFLNAREGHGNIRVRDRSTAPKLPE